jgi:hypothetical protein
MKERIIKNKKLSEALKGRKLSEEHKRKIKEAQHHSEKAYNWAGDNPTIKTLHQYLRRYIPMPELCPECNKVPPRDLANITGIYNREFSNWKWMCKGCHQRYDVKVGFRTSKYLFKKGQAPWNKGITWFKTKKKSNSNG